MPALTGLKSRSGLKSALRRALSGCSNPRAILMRSLAVIELTFPGSFRARRPRTPPCLRGARAGRLEPARPAPPSTRLLFGVDDDAAAAEVLRIAARHGVVGGGSRLIVVIDHAAGAVRYFHA